MKSQNWFAVALLGVVAGCSGRDDGGAAQEADDTFDSHQVVDGALTHARPEIGILYTNSGQCTATLISSRAIVTAKHCLGFTTCDHAGCGDEHGAVLYLEDTLYQTYERFDVDRFVSFRKRGRVPAGENSSASDIESTRSDYTLTDDVAVALLKSDVPSWLARPARIKHREPTSHTPLRLWGYGCTERGTQGDTRKRYFDFSVGTPTTNLCPGDSGGPVTIGSDGPIAFVNGAYQIFTGGDEFGDVTKFYDLIAAQLVQWGESLDEADQGMGWMSEDWSAGSNLPAPTLLGPSDDQQFSPEEIVYPEQITFSWSEVSEATQYEFQWRYHNDSFHGTMKWNSIVNLDSKEPSMTLNLPIADTGYKWRVVAKDDSKVLGYSPWSYLIFDDDYPAAPTGLAPSGNQHLAHQYITFSCEEVAPATGYEFEFEYHDGLSWRHYDTYTPSKPEQTFWPELPDRPYRWRARVVTADGISPSSPWSHFLYGAASAIDGDSAIDDTDTSETSETSDSDDTIDDGGDETYPIVISGTIARKEWHHHGPFEVADGEQLLVQMTDEGDADLFVRRGHEPTMSDYDCHPFSSGGDEECLMAHAGSYYVSLSGFDESSDYTLTLTKP